MLHYALLLLFASSRLVSAQYASDINNKYNDSCNKSSIKVTNVVSVNDLCYWTTTEWRDFTLRTDSSPCNLHGNEGNYIPSRCIPTQIRIYNGRVYVLFNREIGVYSSISYFEMKDIKKDKKCPKLECFRDCNRTQLADINNCVDSYNYLINVRDIQFTASKEAWLLDIGVYFNGKTQIINRFPRLCLYDVSGSKASQDSCVNIPSEFFNEGNQAGFNAIFVNEAKGVGNHFVYILNSLSASIVVYDQNKDEFRRVRSALFRPEPSNSKFSFTLQNYKKYETIVHDGIFSGVLDKYGLIVSAKASDDPYFISYDVLNNEERAECNELSYNIKDLGEYNNKGQTYGMTRNNDVLFFIQPQNYALVCANRKRKIDPDSIQYLIVDRCRLSHLTSITIYKKELYLLSNNLIDITVNKFDKRKKNFVISYLNLNEIEALYPQCLSFFENSYDSTDLCDEEAFTYRIAAKQLRTYETYDDDYQHKVCNEKYPNGNPKKCGCDNVDSDDDPQKKPYKMNYYSLDKILRPACKYHPTSGSK